MASTTALTTSPTSAAVVKISCSITSPTWSASAVATESTSPGSRSVRAPAGAEHVRGDLGPQPVALHLLGADADPRAEPIAQAQHREVHAQDGAPEQQLTDVAGRDRPVDHDADQHRYTAPRTPATG